jgi:hypothetical protein
MAKNPAPSAEEMLNDEVEGYTTYRVQAERHKNQPQLSKTFDSMAGDELNHFRILSQLKEHALINPTYPMIIKAGHSKMEAMTEKIKSKHTSPKIIYFDAHSKPLHYRMVDQDGKIIKRYFWRFTDNQGNFYTADRAFPFVGGGKKLKPAEKYEPTIGSGRLMEVLKYIPASREKNYIFTSGYNVRGKSKQFYKFMDYLLRKKLIAVVPIVFRTGVVSHFGLLCPRKNISGQYSIVIKIVSEKVIPDWHKPVIPLEQIKSKVKQKKKHLKKMKKVI